MYFILSEYSYRLEDDYLAAIGCFNTKQKQIYVICIISFQPETNKEEVCSNRNTTS